MKKAFALLLALCTLLTACRPSSPGEDSTADSHTTTTNPPIHTPSTPAKDLIISEVMPDNKDLHLGGDADWIELYNREESAVSLDGYYLTDDLNNPSDLSLAGKQIPAGGYLVIVLDEEADFHLSTAGETVYLTRGGAVVAKLTYGAVLDGESYSPEGALRWATPGFANTEEGYRAYLDTVRLPDLIVSEVISSNQSHLPQDGECYDLVEVQNISDQPLKLGDYTLSDKRKEPARYHFPDVTLAPGEFYVVFCSGDTSLGKNHAPFKISSDGETVYLAKEGKITDVLRIPGDLKQDESFGRAGNYPVYLTSPTPGKANTDGHLTGVAAPVASLASGVYEDEVTVMLSGGGTIHYTLDGSRPTEKSPVYHEPLLITDVTTIRAYCVDGERSSSCVAYTYIVGAAHDLPVVTVAIPEASLTGSKGVLNHVDKDYEYEAVLTLIEDGEEKFSVPFGFRLHGNDSRKSAKQNFQLRFRSEYGAGKLRYPLFDSREFTEYDSLLLKGGSEDWNNSMMRDEVCTAVVDGTTALYAQAIKPCVLYLGGEYWGIYYLRERFSDEYVASHLGVSADSVNLIVGNGSVQNGTSREYNELLNYVKTHDMSKKEHYQYLCDKIDINSLMDWYICRSYMGDKDLANIRYFQSSEHDNKWRWMYFDLDWALYHTDDRPIASTLLENGKHPLILAAVESKEGKDAFIRRYAELMDTVLNEEYIIGIIDSLAAQVESEVERDRARWGSSVTKWNNSVEKLRAYFRDGVRDENVLEDIQDYFNLSDSQMKSYFG
ncbi:MAG: CotH kinase family protein [Clostridia bacterium]|nr:CotH kinase family protein [Clostridia bacterium]